ncbi:hypothetical protein M141_2750 [Bacteroides fragilis str. S38L5]|nr:hypothetical protein M080_2647 [Bacteroides fragilis str. 3397 T10]EXY45848.1 hypothetical protein M118_2639 [Bacteroides fragilis str. 3783N1-2]EXY50618.1 hypothetical protein M121_2603 [Bacteroides fragilis str. 3783N2-1]EXY55411.1 hypothetical protein M122_2547 [Bacteroides fragilis str. 3976T7]EXZ67363.1 hypothetical protein M120_3140 [Bacteroides fragilis str. 3783N1-8]EXZ94014.1 hypothetical protein M065_3691 [Bacteroides fragilis str. Korea 419]EYA95266.1 hypothetical protein M141_2
MGCAGTQRKQANTKNDISESFHGIIIIHYSNLFISPQVTRIFTGLLILKTTGINH